MRLEENEAGVCGEGPRRPAGVKQGTCNTGTKKEAQTMHEGGEGRKGTKADKGGNERKEQRKRKGGSRRKDASQRPGGWQRR